MRNISRQTLSTNRAPPSLVWVLGVFLRTLFIVLLIAITARVASPQIETIWSAYETPGELIRMLLGLVVCLWLAANVFRLPKDADGYRIWLYLGLAVVPLASLCAVVIW
jgi:hypothetical protein